MRTGIRVAAVVCLFLVCAGKEARGQIVIQYPGTPRYELGAQFTAVAPGGPVDAGNLGPGLHFGYNYNEFLALESDLNGYHPVTFFLGPRIGYTSRDLGVYVKARPGLIHFTSGESSIAPIEKNPTHFALDTGVVLARYFESGFYVRCDVGRIFVNYGGGSYTDPVTRQTYHLGTPGGFLGSIGIGARW